MITPSGRYLGAVRDQPDPRDHRFEMLHMAKRAMSLPTSVDLRSHLPSPFDQGQEGSCGACSGSALMCFLQGTSEGYSRQQIYYDIRVLERTPINSDAGVQTRDVLKVLNKLGTVPESEWPYTPENFAVAPPIGMRDAVKIGSYSRLVTETEYLACLAQGFPFILGFVCFESIDSDQLAKTGVMGMPDPKEQVVGGHDVLISGYDLHFKSTDTFKASGVDPNSVSDEFLLVRNSWGTSWGLQGYFWMPLSYATNPSTGGDAWTGRL